MVFEIMGTCVKAHSDQPDYLFKVVIIMLEDFLCISYVWLTH